MVIKLTFDGQFHCEIIYLKCSSRFMNDSISVSSYFRNSIEYDFMVHKYAISENAAMQFLELFLNETLYSFSIK